MNNSMYQGPTEILKKGMIQEGMDIAPAFVLHEMTFDLTDWTGANV